MPHCLSCTCLFTVHTSPPDTSSPPPHAPLPAWQARAHDDRRLEQLRVQLTEAFGLELSAQQRQCEGLERDAAGWAAEGERLRGLVADRDDQIQFLTGKHQVGRGEGGC